MSQEEIEIIKKYIETSLKTAEYANVIIINDNTIKKKKREKKHITKKEKETEKEYLTEQIFFLQKIRGRIDVLEIIINDYREKEEIKKFLEKINEMRKNLMKIFGEEYAILLKRI